MLFRLAKEYDIEQICDIVKDAIVEMEKRHIYQWDDLYPNKKDFVEDIKKCQLYVGIMDLDIAVIYAINQEFDEAYQNGNWKYKDCSYRIIHRLCVNPIYQGQGIATETLKHIEDELRKSNIETIRLDVYSQNPVALALYSRQGYKNVGIANWRKGRFFLMEKHL